MGVVLGVVGELVLGEDVLRPELGGRAGGDHRPVVEHDLIEARASAAVSSDAKRDGRTSGGNEAHGVGSAGQAEADGVRDEDDGAVLHEVALEAVLEQEGGGGGVDGRKDVVPATRGRLSSSDRRSRGCSQAEGSRGRTG